MIARMRSRHLFREEYWNLEAKLQQGGSKKIMTAKFHGTKQEKLAIHSREEARANCGRSSGQELYCGGYPKQGERTKKPPIPFTTSTLQQEASKVLNFSTQKTMRLAQQLYEGVDVQGRGTIGLITYLRTDSTRIADEADAMAREYINSNYGEKYVLQNEQARKVERKDSGRTRGNSSDGYYA